MNSAAVVECAARCPRCDCPLTEGRCDPCKRREMRPVYRTCRPVMIKVSGYEVQAYVYDVRNVLAHEAMRLGRTLGRPGRESNLTEVGYTVAGDLVRLDGGDRRLPLPLRAGKRRLTGLLSTQGRNKLHVQWLCEHCGGTGRMLAGDWRRKAQGVKLRGAFCELCAHVARPYAKPKRREPTRALAPRGR